MNSTLKKKIIEAMQEVQAAKMEVAECQKTLNLAICEVLDEEKKVSFAFSKEGSSLKEKAAELEKAGQYGFEHVDLDDGARLQLVPEEVYIDESSIPWLKAIDETDTGKLEEVDIILDEIEDKSVIAEFILTCIKK